MHIRLCFCEDWSFWAQCCFQNWISWVKCTCRTTFAVWSGARSDFSPLQLYSFCKALCLTSPPLLCVCEVHYFRTAFLWSYVLKSKATLPPLDISVLTQMILQHLCHSFSAVYLYYSVFSVRLAECKVILTTIYYYFKKSKEKWWVLQVFFVFLLVCIATKKKKVSESI